MKGVIIFYADDLEYSTGKLWNLVEEGKQKISEQSKISPDKIQLLFGGYRDSIQMEFWVMPKMVNSQLRNQIRELSKKKPKNNNFR